jgi:hypothetical protein
MSAAPDDVSISATDATVAGSSVAVTEAYEDDDDDDDDDVNVHPTASPPAGPDDGASPPHPPATLTIANPPPPDALPSPLPTHLLDLDRGLHTGHSHHHTPESIDPDILLDGMGLRDLDAGATQEGVQELLRMHHHDNSRHLPALNERMSEGAMRDEGAFRDLSPPPPPPSPGVSGDGRGHSPPKAQRSLVESRIGLGASARSLELNTLDEVDEDSEDNDDDDDDEDNSGPKIPNGSIPPGATSKNTDDARVEVPASITKELIASDGKQESFYCDEAGDDDEVAAFRADSAEDGKVRR